MCFVLKKSASCSGVGVHSGSRIQLTFHPAPAGVGRVFRRTDLSENNVIEAKLEHVVDTKFNTSLGNEEGVRVSTVEHVLAALSTAGVSDVYIDVDGPEMPIMDGSAAPFLELVRAAGVEDASHTKETLVLTQPLSIQTDYGAHMTLEPCDVFSIDVTQDFKGREGVEAQRSVIEDVYHHFASDISKARTFGFYEDAEKMWAAGLSKGASLDNTVVIQEGAVMNEDGVRFDNECARHKILDVVGDFSLLGWPLKLYCKTYNPGHHLNYLMMKKVLDTPSAWYLEK